MQVLPPAVYRHLHFKGWFRVKVSPTESFHLYHTGNMIENEIFWEGLYKGWEGKSMETWVALCRKSQTILDIGANTGVYALAAKAVQPSSRVIAFEPVHRVWQKLDSNVRKNGHDTLCLELAASNFDGQAMIFDPLTEHVFSVTVNQNLSGAGEALNVEIKTTRLETVIVEQQMGGIDLMKIDVETHEPEVLEGMGLYLEKYRPDMLIEVLADAIAEKIEAKIAGLNYHRYFIDDKNRKLVPMEKIRKGDSFNYLLCSAETARYLGLELLHL